MISWLQHTKATVLASIINPNSWRKALDWSYLVWVCLTFCLLWTRLPFFCFAPESRPQPLVGRVSHTPYQLASGEFSHWKIGEPMKGKSRVPPSPPPSCSAVVASSPRSAWWSSPLDSGNTNFSLCPFQPRGSDDFLGYLTTLSGFSVLPSFV